MAKPRKIKVNNADRREADQHNRQAVLDYVARAKDHALADTILHNIDLFESINDVMDWDIARDAIISGQRDVRGVVHDILDRADQKQLDALKIKDPKFDRVKPEDLARARIEKQARFENQYGHANAILARGTDHIAKSVGSFAKFNIGDGAFHLTAASLDLLHGGRLQAQKALGIRPAAGAIIGTLSVVNAFIGTAAYAGTPYQIQYSNAHMMSAFQQACLTNDSTINAAFDMAFSPEANPENNESAYHSMKVAQMHGVPPLAAYLISYLESNRHRDLVANNSSASGYMQIIDSTKLDYIHRYGQDTFTYKEAKDAIEAGTGSPIDLSNKRLIVSAIDTIAGTSLDKLKEMVDLKKYPDVIFNGLALADNSIMQVELVAIDMMKKTNIASAGTPEEILGETSLYYQKDHFLGSGNYNVLEMLSTQFPSTPITAASDVLGYRAGQNMINVVTGNPGLLKEGMTAHEALASIEQNFREIVGPAYNKFLAAHDEAKSVPETCLVDFHTAQAHGDAHIVTKGEFTVQLIGKAFTALTPAFAGSGAQQGGENFAASTTLTPQKTAVIPLPLERPEHLL